MTPEDKKELTETLGDDLYQVLYGEQDKLLKRTTFEDAEFSRAIERVLSTRDGQLLFEKLFAICQVNSTVFTGNSKTYYLLGMQAVGLVFKRMIMDVDPDLYFAIERNVWQPIRKDNKES